jgi:hypothetical protein
MTKQLDDMWSSKWVLPEHREELIEDVRSLKRMTKPDLDEQEVAAIDQAINSATKYNKVIILTVFSKYELKTVIGAVLKLDSILKMVKIIHEDPSVKDDECIWVHMRDVLKAEVKEIEVWDEEDIDW